MIYEIPHENCPEQDGTFRLRASRINDTNIYVCDRCNERREIKEIKEK